jgi:Icc-related predicted phosphoesterase
LEKLLSGWEKPVLFVAGNHEYYTRMPMRENEEEFRAWLAESLPQVYFLRDEGIAIDGVNFFGGTMWTSFRSGNTAAMRHAETALNDFRYILNDEGLFTPEYSVEQHQQFIAALERWYGTQRPGPNIIITHHAPVINPRSQYLLSPLEPAFVSYEMGSYIETYEPDLWIYGHTHECDTQRVGKTQIISNQLGYPRRSGGYESAGAFDNYGCLVEV